MATPDDTLLPPTRRCFQGLLNEAFAEGFMAATNRPLTSEEMAAMNACTERLASSYPCITDAPAEALHVLGARFLEVSNRQKAY